jgi:hypothetical protein
MRLLKIINKYKHNGISSIKSHYVWILFQLDEWYGKMVTNDKHVKTWMAMVVTYLKESGGQLPKTDLFVSSLKKPFQLHNLQAHV